jgi:hypothetical protein
LSLGSVRFVSPFRRMRNVFAVLNLSKNVFKELFQNTQVSETEQQFEPDSLSTNRMCLRFVSFRYVSRSINKALLTISKIDKKSTTNSGSHKCGADSRLVFLSRRVFPTWRPLRDLVNPIRTR